MTTLDELARDLAAVSDEYARTWDDLARLLIARGWDKPARPRVFFDGDTVPAGVRVITEGGCIYPDLDDIEEEWTNGLGPVVEVLTDYGAELGRALRERYPELLERTLDDRGDDEETQA